MRTRRSEMKMTEEERILRLTETEFEGILYTYEQFWKDVPDFIPKRYEDLEHAPRPEKEIRDFWSHVDKNGWIHAITVQWICPYLSEETKQPKAEMDKMIEEQGINPIPTNEVPDWEGPTEKEWKDYQKALSEEKKDR